VYAGEYANANGVTYVPCGGNGHSLYYWGNPARADTFPPASYNQASASYCVVVWFYGNGGGSDDQLNGPIRSNDELFVEDTPKFNGPAADEDPNAPYYYKYDNNSAPSPNTPTHAGPMAMPTTDNQLSTLANPADGGEGCLFAGPTSITFNTDGSFNVLSPATAYLVGQGQNLGCAATAAAVNGTYAASTVVTPNSTFNGVIYVEDVPSSAIDPWYNCASGVMGSPNAAGYPTYATDVTNYGCKNGDAYVSDNGANTITGQFTISAENNIWITGNLEYTGALAGNNVLGLIANNDIFVYNPVKCNGNWSAANQTCTGTPGTFANLLGTPISTIDAALLAIYHTFSVSNYDRGASLGTLTVNGSIAQEYRGPVAITGGSGYVKNYNYDARLAYLGPPYYLQPSTSGWVIRSWTEGCDAGLATCSALHRAVPPPTTTTSTTSPTTSTSTTSTTSTTLPTTTTTHPTTTTTSTTTTTVPTTTTSTSTTTTSTTTTSTSTTSTTLPTLNCSASASGTAYNRSSWNVSANNNNVAPGNTDAPAYAIDGNLSTRYSSEVQQVAGMYFQIDMGASQAFDEVDMQVPNSVNDYAYGYTIEASNLSNFSSYTTVGTCSTGLGTTEIVSFPAQTDRYIRVVLTGNPGLGVSASPQNWWWSIDEINVYH
jgi:hypothetical protein